MDFFISNAYAQAPAPQGPGLIESLLPLLIIFAIFWFLLIRPQQKKVKEHKQMVEALSKGDEIVTNGGLLGKVTKVGDNFLTVEIADGLEVRVQRMSISSIVPKGTIRSV